ncbi:hypothetical protein C5167_032156 [Papaver somniferum]|uniref:Uncharacterized protein n=1 Tax=Papaver somniferum TaxID=3469 RepID=A0A4Y7KAI9_PAPSO|nr:hypothetical protein C5167_032156 [Papaver somniferum]
MHNYIYQTSNHRKIVRNSVTGPEFGIPSSTTSSTTGEFVTKLIQLNKEKMQKQRWEASMQVENIRTSKTKGTKTRKNTSKMDRDLDYAPIEDRLIVTDLGKEKYLATPEN